MRMFYLRNKKGLPVTCVASEVLPDGIRFSLATYNPKDKFKKEEMRKIAAQRLHDGKRTFIPVPLESVPAPPLGSAVKLRIIKAIIQNTDTYVLKDGQGEPVLYKGEPLVRRIIPHRAKNVARLWLKRREKAANNEKATK